MRKWVCIFLIEYGRAGYDIKTLVVGLYADQAFRLKYYQANVLMRLTIVGKKHAS